MTRPQYTVDATRVAGGWALQCREHPVATVTVPRLLDGAAPMRKAIAIAANIAPETFDIDVITMQSSTSPNHPRRRHWRA